MSLVEIIIGLFLEDFPVRFLHFSFCQIHCFRGVKMAARQLRQLFL